MRATSLTLTIAGYNSYDNRSNYDGKMDYVAQDIKNINNLK